MQAYYDTAPDPDNTGGGKCLFDLYKIVIKRLRGFSARAFFFEGGIMSNPQASIAIQVLPQSVTGDEVLRIVDKVIAYIKSAGLKTVVGPFETVIEGEFDKLMEIAKECQLICIREGAASLLTYMKVAYNPNGGVWSIDEKIAKHI
jgi:uncharacterized protein YqgV (UPF0045/DUF77 family)